MKFKFLPILAILVLCFASQGSFASTPKDSTKKSAVFAEPKEVLPEFPGGQQKLTAFIKSNLRSIPGAAGKRIMVYFVVEKTGKLNHIKVIKGANPAANNEAIRVMKLSPKWKPGSQNGVIRRVAYTTQVVFS
jgi:protein TonB